MIILGMDTETTGISPEIDRVIELGMVLWNTELHRPMRSIGFYVKPDIEIPDERWAEAEAIHHIPRAVVEKYGLTAPSALRTFDQWAAHADAIVAHNGTLFDKAFMDAWHEREGVAVINPLWIDTRLDIPKPMIGKLTQIAATLEDAEGRSIGFVNAFPHSALTDTLTMLKILDIHPIEQVMARARIPNITVKAMIPIQLKDRARERGYYWRPEGKHWLKTIKESDFERERAEAGFRIERFNE